MKSDGHDCVPLRRSNSFSAARSESDGAASSSSSGPPPRSRALVAMAARRAGGAAPCPLHVRANGWEHLMLASRRPQSRPVHLLPSPLAVTMAARIRGKLLRPLLRLGYLSSQLFPLGFVYTPSSFHSPPTSLSKLPAPQDHSPPLMPVELHGEGGNQWLSRSGSCCSSSLPPWWCLTRS